jgi:hypothetical protein
MSSNQRFIALAQSYLLFASLGSAIVVLSGCGGGGAATSTTTPVVSLSGQVIKGPVNGAKVCAYAVQGGKQEATPLVACVTSGANGQYDISLPAEYSGDVFIEASGGTYVDESSGQSKALSEPLSSFVAASEPKVGIVTPLTSLAVSRSSSLNTEAFNAASQSVKAQTGLAADVNLTQTAPTFSSDSRTATNAYAVILGAISQFMSSNQASLAQTTIALGATNQNAFKDAVNAYVVAQGVSSALIPSKFTSAATSGGSSSMPIALPATTAITPPITPPSNALAGPSGMAIAQEFSSVVVKMSPSVAEIYKGEAAVFTVAMTGGPAGGLSYRFYLPTAPTATLSRFVSEAGVGRVFEHSDFFATVKTGSGDVGTLQLNVEVFQTISGVKKKVGEASSTIPVRDVQPALISLSVDYENIGLGVLNSPPLPGIQLGWSFPIMPGAKHYIYTILNATTGKPTARYRILQADALATPSATRLVYAFCAQGDLTCERQTFITGPDELSGKDNGFFLRRGNTIYVGISAQGCYGGQYGVELQPCDPVQESNKYPPFTVLVYY